MAKIDIILPYWGDFKLLKIAVDSILMQTESDWRLLIIDDCYPSLEAKEFYSNYPDKRVAYHRHSSNLGLVKNYNFGIDKIRAEYCVIMGCDDIMLPNYIETALKQIKNADCYQPGVGVIDLSGTRYMPIADRIKKMLRPPKDGVYSGEKVVASLCKGNWLYFPSITWRSDTLKRHRFDTNYPNTQDLILCLNILEEGGAISIDNMESFLYRRSKESFSSRAKAGTRFQEEAELYNDLAKKYQKLGWKKAARAARLHFTVRLHKAYSRIS